MSDDAAAAPTPDPVPANTPANTEIDRGRAGAPNDESMSVEPRELKRRLRAWALWDWGSAAFNAVVSTFVFATYLASSLFIDPEVLAITGGDTEHPLRLAADAANASVISTAIAIAGVLIAALAPVLGQRSDGSGRRKFWLGVNTGIVVLTILAMFFVAPVPSYLYLGAGLLAVGNIFFEFAEVNYHAMIVQVSTRANRGWASGFGWGMGYIGGIVLLGLLLVLFVQNFGEEGRNGLLGLPSGAEGGALDVRFAIVAAAIWFAVFAIPVLRRVPEIPADRERPRVNFVRSYAVLWRTIVSLRRKNPHVLLFLLASAVFRDGLSSVFALGGVIAMVVFNFSSAEVLYFAVAANLVAGLGTFAGGWLDDRIGAKKVMIGALLGLVVAGLVVFALGTFKPGFWVFGLALCLFVGPVQAASRSFLARVTPPGREGELFGLYTTSGRAVGFLAAGSFAILVTVTEQTRYGILGIVLVLLIGLLLLLPVKPKPAAID